MIARIAAPVRSAPVDTVCSHAAPNDLSPGTPPRGAARGKPWRGGGMPRSLSRLEERIFHSMSSDTSEAVDRPGDGWSFCRAA